MGTHPIFESDFDCLTEMKMLKSLKKVGKKISKKEKQPNQDDFDQEPLRRSKSNPQLQSIPELQSVEKRLRPRSARPGVFPPPVSDLHELEPEHKFATSCTQTEQSYFGNVEVCEKIAEQKQKKISTDLHPIYISALLILVGFNFSAFITTYENTIKAYSIAFSISSGFAVAAFLRKFIGLNLFKTSDKVTERAVLTIVTQIRLVYNFLFHGNEQESYSWSLFLYVLSISILFLDKVSAPIGSACLAKVKTTIGTMRQWTTEQTNLIANFFSNSSLFGLEAYSHVKSTQFN